MPRQTFLKRALLGTPNAATAPLEGLRALFSYFVVAGHTYMFTSFVLDVPKPLSQLDPTATTFHHIWQTLSRLGVYAAVDIFLLLSGFFLAASLARHAGDIGEGTLRNCKRLTTRSLVRYLVSRWLRLAPVYLLVAMRFAMLGQTTCIGWREVLFLHNNVSGPDACVGVGWSIHVDFQMHVIIGLLATIVPSWQSLQNVLLSMAFLIGIGRSVTWEFAGRPRRMTTSMVDYLNDADQVPIVEKFLGLKAGRFSLRDTELVTRRMRLLAYAPWDASTFARGGVVCLGAATWLAMRENRPFCRMVRLWPRMVLMGVGVVWMGFFGGMRRFYGEGEVGVWFVGYEGFGRLFVAGATCVLVMVVGEVGMGGEEKLGRGTAMVGLVRRVFGGWVGGFLGRVSYVVYLVHPFVVWVLGFGWPRLSRDDYTTMKVNWAGLKLYIVSVIVALPICVFEEVGLVARRYIVDRMFGKVVNKRKA